MEKRLERYASKRNVVFKRDGWVYKCHWDASAARAEAGLLRRLSGQGVPVPQLRHQVGRVLVQRPVPGLPLPDLLCSAAPRLDTDAVARGLVNWLQAFYAAVDHNTTGENRGDVNGRNFLVDGCAVWGVDFETRSYGAREEDFGRLAAFIERYDNCDKQLAAQLSAALIRRGVLQLGLNAALVESEKQREFAAMKARRAKDRSGTQQ